MKFAAERTFLRNHPGRWLCLGQQSGEDESHEAGICGRCHPRPDPRRGRPGSMADGARRISPLRTQARVGDPLREASRRPSRNHRVATFPCLLGVAVLQVGLEESLPAQGKHLVAVLLLKQPDRGRSAIYLARDRLHVCVSRRPPLPGAPRILRCHEEGGGERSDGQLKAFFASPAAPRSPESSTPTWSGASESRPDPPRSHYGRRQSG
jgi:hypothetical protein